jgi:hypothetical protein
MAMRKGGMAKAFQLCVDTVRTIGDNKFPKKSPSLLLRVVPLLLKMKRVLRGISDEDLLNLPKNTEANCILISNLHVSLQQLAQGSGNKPYMALSLLQGLETSIKHGYSISTPQSFAAFGFLRAMMGDVGEAIRYGNLALKMLERFDLGETARCRSLTQAHGTVLHMNNLRVSSVPVYNAIVEGLACGEEEASMVGTSLFTMNRLNDGENLTIVGGDLFSLHERFADFGNPLLLYHKSAMALVMNLKNDSTVDATTLTNSNLVEESTTLRVAHESNDKVLIGLIGLLKLFLLFHFGQVGDTSMWRPFMERKWWSEGGFRHIAALSNERALVALE